MYVDFMILSLASSKMLHDKCFSRYDFFKIYLQTSPRGQQSRASGNDEQKAICIDTMSIQYRYNIDTISIQYRYNTIPKVPKNTQKYPEIPKNTQKYPKVPKNIRKYPKVPQVPRTTEVP